MTSDFCVSQIVLFWDNVWWSSQRSSAWTNSILTDCSLESVTSAFTAARIARCTLLGVPALLASRLVFLLLSLSERRETLCGSYYKWQRLRVPRAEVPLTTERGVNTASAGLSASAQPSLRQCLSPCRRCLIDLSVKWSLVWYFTRFHTHNPSATFIQVVKCLRSVTVLIIRILT